MRSSSLCLDSNTEESCVFDPLCLLVFRKIIGIEFSKLPIYGPSFLLSSLDNSVSGNVGPL